MTALKNYTYAAALACLGALAGCGSSEGESGPKTEYDRQAMLTNYADNLIIPGYQKFKTEAGEMASAVTAFTASPSTTTLTNARKEYQEAYLAWQDVSAYGFGPADEQLLRSNLNIYPTTTSQVENNISSGNYNLQTTANLSAKGFPALDYLLYGQASDAATVDRFTTAANAANRRKYLQDITNLIKDAAEATHTAWTTGNTAKNFKETGGTAVGSSIGNLVNQFNFEVDLTKRAKVGIPSGRFSANTPVPDRVEAYYSQNSLALLERNLKALKATFMGQSAAGANGPGLDDYLDHVDAKYGDKNLSTAIIQQFDAALAAVAAVPVPLSQAVTSSPQAVTKVYDELQKLIVLVKTDMPAALGVTITYTDNDGD
ncbi:imelysin family protein [Pontibacter sp. JH31]|uniref:Imelysin family protein n=1 Tax=Pontibacter aquaedesilientis TaxID=2766980 RepID=A0ABR7XEK2_9BACT|nr:imelysin family protein [Pontibacter aquaedesilientis]MBD1396726.1 imelysin family protein [Pontibacter aquaedesilientis]